jgi:glutaminase
VSDAEPVSPIQRYLDALHRRHAADRSGQLATYIPELAQADPDCFGICIATPDGHVYEAGDSRIPFTIQSISKPFAYGLALGDRPAHVRGRWASPRARPSTRSGWRPTAGGRSIRW